MAATPPGLSQGIPGTSDDTILGEANAIALGIEATAFEQLQIADSPIGNAQVAGGMFSIMRFGLALRNRVTSMFSRQEAMMSVLEGKIGLTESRLEDTKNKLEGKICLLYTSPSPRD